MHYNNEFVFEDRNHYLEACEFLKRALEERNSMPHGQDPETPLVANCDDDKLTISFGETCSNSYDGWFLEIPERLAREFPSAQFQSTTWTDLGDYWWANNRDGKIVPVNHHEEIYEMMWRWQIDVADPFAGPTEENWAELKRCREQHVQEMIAMGVDIAPGTWPPTQEQEDEFERLMHPEMRPGSNADTDSDADAALEDVDLPF